MGELVIGLAQSFGRLLWEGGGEDTWMGFHEEGVGKVKGKGEGKGGIGSRC